MKILRAHVDIADFFKNIREGQSLLLMDYDGTLAPLMKERMQAFPYPGVKNRLDALISLKTTRTVIISGRSLSELDTLLGMPPRLELWGSHGWERRRPNGTKDFAALSAEMREGLEQGVKACCEFNRPECCEIKPYAVALHWRGEDPKKNLDGIKSTEGIWENICKKYNFEIYYFDGGVELRPRGWNKGDVVRQLMSESQNVSSIAYLGDDVTDEDAFEALGLMGLKVLVREQFRPTLADILLIPPQELLFFLDRWILNAR